MRKLRPRERKQLAQSGAGKSEPQNLTARRQSRAGDHSARVRTPTCLWPLSRDSAPGGPGLTSASQGTAQYPASSTSPQLAQRRT